MNTTTTAPAKSEATGTTPHHVLHALVLGLLRQGYDARIRRDARDNWTVEADVFVTLPDGARHRLRIDVSDTFRTT